LQEALQGKLKSILVRRDEIISDLTSLNPNSADKLRALCRELHGQALAKTK
jgi:hypothetical protein